MHAKIYQIPIYINKLLKKLNEMFCDVCDELVDLLSANVILM